VQGAPLLAGQGLEQLVLDQSELAVGLLKLARPGGGHLDDVPPAVGRIAPAGDETPLLKLVEQADDVARVQAEGRADRVLRHRALLVEQRERDHMPRPEAAIGHGRVGGPAADPGEVVDERQDLLSRCHR
jgi:hypothetical protein